jgi:hypothetical protein
MSKYDPFKFMEMLGKGQKISDRDDALRVDTDDYTIDTCMCYDTGKWETGIHKRSEEWVIVEDYNDADEAKIGHDKWVKLMEEKPTTELESIQKWDVDWNSTDYTDEDNGVDDQ